MQRFRSPEPYRIAFELAASGLALGSVKGTVLRANRALWEMLGYDSEADLVGRSFRDIVHPEDAERVVEQLGQVLSGERRSYQTERRLLHRDGSTVPVLVSAALVRDADGRPWYVAAQVQELSSTHEEHELRRTAALVEERHRVAAFVSERIDPSLVALYQHVGEDEEARRLVEAVVDAIEQLRSSQIADDDLDATANGSNFH